MGEPKPAFVDPAEVHKVHWEIIDSTQGLELLGGSASVLFLLAFVLAWRVDINQFSMHMFYRNRLVRCYMGASNDRRVQQPFTGFDAQDDERLVIFDRSAQPLSSDRECQERKNLRGAIFLINAALTL